MLKSPHFITCPLWHTHFDDVNRHVSFDVRLVGDTVESAHLKVETFARFERTSRAYLTSELIYAKSIAHWLIDDFIGASKAATAILISSPNRHKLLVDRLGFNQRSIIWLLFEFQIQHLNQHRNSFICLFIFNLNIL